jgi:hypothetical protein
MVEMIGLLLILFSVTIGGVVFSKYIAASVAGRSAVYQYSYRIHKDHIGAENFYTDIVEDQVRNYLILTGYDLNNFCPNDVDTAALETYMETRLDMFLESIKYKYKTHKLKKMEISKIEKNANELSVTIKAVEPIKITYDEISHVMTSISTPEYIETFSVSGIGCVAEER